MNNEERQTAGGRKHRSPDVVGDRFSFIENKTKVLRGKYLTFHANYWTMAARKWENQDEIQKNKILKVLKENKKLEYLSIKQISDLSGMHRNTVTKYMPDLEKRGKIASLKVGRWYIYKMK